MKNKIKLILSILLIIVFSAGCDTDELHDMNINPNAVNQIDMNYFFTAASLGIASNGSSGDNRYTDWRTNINFASTCIQQLATTSGTAGDKYMDNDMEPMNAPFQFYYRDVARRTSEIIKQTGIGGYDEGKKINTRHAARILQVLTYHRLTDWYGSVPYTEANRGLEGIFQPKYDKQRVIYTDLLNELDEACAGLSTSNLDEGFTAADFIYNGDIAKWKKFGYSLMLRLAMRVSNVDAAMAATYVSKAVAGGVMTSNDDNVWVEMALSPSEWRNQNGISRAFYPGDGGAWQGTLLSKTLVDMLKGANTANTVDDDPRLMIFTGGIVKWEVAGITVIDDDPLNQEGLPNGLDGPGLNALFGTTVTAYEHFSAVNFLMMQDDEPYQVMNAAESKFLMAEALERGIGSGISGTVQENYEDGVKLAMQLYDKYDASLAVTDGEVNQYLAQHPFVAGSALEMIGTQLWLSKFMNWWDAWSDWRRTGYPALIPTNYPGNSTGGTIPVRLQIPAAEAAGNPNYAATATLPDNMTTKVWWDGGDE
jgi:SusD/RagB-like outer membrane lipoprotein